MPERGNTGQSLSRPVSFEGWVTLMVQALSGKLPMQRERMLAYRRHGSTHPNADLDPSSKLVEHSIVPAVFTNSRHSLFGSSASPSPQQRQEPYLTTIRDPSREQLHSQYVDHFADRVKDFEMFGRSSFRNCPKSDLIENQIIHRKLATRCEKGESQSALEESYLRTFPFVLYKMLTDAEKEGNEHILSWVDEHGRAFLVHDREALERDIVPR